MTARENCIAAVRKCLTALIRNPDRKHGVGEALDILYNALERLEGTSLKLDPWVMAEPTYPESASYGDLSVFGGDLDKKLKKPKQTTRWAWRGYHVKVGWSRHE